MAYSTAQAGRLLQASAALVCLVAMINAANRLGVIVRQQGGSYQPGMLANFTG